MSNRSFEMYQYRQIIFHMRQGQSDRAIAKLKLAGREKCNHIRQVALKNGWLNSDSPLPEDAVLAVPFAKPQPKNALPLATPFEMQIKEWYAQGVNGKTIYNALVRKYQYAGSYDSVKRYLRRLRDESDSPKASCVLSFKPAEAAQVDFGKGPLIKDVATGIEISTWIFVMTLCYSRHMYIEIVPDQSSMT